MAKYTTPFSLFRLWRDLSQRSIHLSARGTLSRRGAVRRAFAVAARPERSTEPRVLIDHNVNKLDAAKSVWGPLAFVNVYEGRPRLVERLALLLGLFLPDRPRRVLQGLGTAHTAKHTLRPDVQLFVWNPTQIIHHCLIDYLGVSDCMIFNPIVPLPRNCQGYSGRPIVRDIYEISTAKFTNVMPAFKTINNSPRFSIYMSKLPDGSTFPISSEARIAKFGIHLWQLGVKTRFFFHYRDRFSMSRIEELGFPIEICDLGQSLTMLSNSQISISASSTIGLDLDAIGAGHFYCLATERTVTMAPSDTLTPLATYLKKSSRTLREELSNEEWISTISEHEPILWKRIMGG